jgi:DNA-binding protein H-NS
MSPRELKMMSADELWSLREQVNAELANKIAAEKAELDRRLQQLGVKPPAAAPRVRRGRRPYPRVFPKFRNPAQPGETWAGRGKQPRWLTAQLRSGKKLDDFRIPSPSGRAGRTSLQ